MGRFERGNRGYSGGRSDRRKSTTTMYPAVCDKCGKDCKVPFKPSSDKPIYCSNCFEKDGSRSSDRFERRGGRDRQRGGGDREMYSAVCDNCGNEARIPFKPSSDKPIYCSKCYEQRGDSNRGERKSSCSCNGQIEKLDTIIVKLDRILLALEGKNIPEVEKKVVKEKAVKKEAVVKEKAVKKESVAKKKAVKKEKATKKK